MPSPCPRKKKVTSHLTPADYLRKHSPIKKGLKIDDEDAPVAKYNKILSNVYLGNYQAAKDKDFFHTKKIKAVLNCSNDIPNHFANKKDVEYMRIPVEDSLKEFDFLKMYQFFPAAVEFIYKHAVLQKHAVFINCFAGRQRSAIIVAAFLMKYCKMTPLEATKYVMDKRVEAFHFGTSLNFDQALEEYYKDIKKCPVKTRKPDFKSHR